MIKKSNKYYKYLQKDNFMIEKNEKDINTIDENDIGDFDEFEDYYGLKDDDDREKELDFNQKYKRS